MAEEPALLPDYKGSMLRGAFGHALRRAVCAMGPQQPCETCSLRPVCVYTRLFETFIEGEPPPFLRGLPTSPRPYVFEPAPAEHGRRDYEPGDPLRFDLLLLGQAVDLQAYAVLALQRMAEGGLGRRRHRFRLARVEHPVAEDPQEGSHADERWAVGYEDGAAGWSGVVPAALPVQGLPDDSATTLRFLTPTRFKNERGLMDRFSFRELAFRSLRRVLELAHFHVPGAEVDWHFRPLLELASRVKIPHRDLRWHDWERWSNRQKTSMRFGGVVGEIRLEGDLAPFAPLLRAAEVAHIGKGTTFGLGQIQVAA